MNIDLGCGNHREPGFVGLDMRELDSVDIVCDLNNGIPLDDNTVDLVKASHILEHIPDLMKIMHEIWRVCKDGSQVAIGVPYYKSRGAWQDPTHVRAFTETTFDYWDPTRFLYTIYEPEAKFNIESLVWATNGNMEAILKVIKNDEEIKTTEEEELRKAGLSEANKKVHKVRKGKRGSTVPRAKHKKAKQ